MKTKLILLIALVVFIVIQSCSGTSTESANQQSEKMAAAEITEFDLDLRPNVIDMDKVIEEMRLFYQSFLINRTRNFDLSEVIDGASLLSKIKAEQSDFNTNDIQGVQIFYTLNSNFKLKTYFIPCLSSPEDVDAPTIQFNFTNDLSNKTLDEILSDPNHTIPVYEYRFDMMVKTSSDNDAISLAKSNWKRYKENVEIINGSNSLRRVWRITNDDLGQEVINPENDAMCVYFPLQELDSLINDNPLNNYLIIQSGSKLVDKSAPPTSKENRHLLILYTSDKKPSLKGTASYEESLKNAINKINELYKSDEKNLKDYLNNQAFVESVRIASELFKGKAANLGQICPTRCKGFSVIGKQMQD